MTFFNVSVFGATNSFSYFPAGDTDSTSVAAGNPFSFSTPYDEFVSTAANAAKDLYGRVVQWAKDAWNDVSLLVRSYLGLVKAAEINGFSLERLSRLNISVLKMLPVEERAEVLGNIAQDAEKIGVLQQWGMKDPDAFKDLMLILDGYGATPRDAFTPMHAFMSDAVCIKALSPLLERLAETRPDAFKELMLAMCAEDKMPIHEVMFMPACIKAFSPFLMRLAEKKPDVFKELMLAKTGEDLTPLHYAMRTADGFKAIDPLLEHLKGTSPYVLKELMSASSKLNYTPLDIAKLRLFGDDELLSRLYDLVKIDTDTSN